MHVDGVAAVDAALSVMPALTHVAVRGHRSPVHVTLSGGVRADLSNYPGVAVDRLTGKYRLVLAQVTIVERHYKVIDGVVRHVYGQGPVAERGGHRQLDQEDEKQATYN